MSASTPEASEDSGEPRRRLRDRFIWQVGSTISWSILQQVLGLLRQVLIAASFGLSREYDGYVVAYSLALMLVFNLSGVFDTIGVSRLVRIRERDGEEAFWRASNRLLTLSVVASLPFASLFLAALWLTMPIIAAGFSPADRALLGQLGWYFLPWIIIIIPYYALSAHLKVCWQFSWVFATEILIIVVSAVAVWLDHDRIASLPIAYSFGYAAGALLLLLRRKLKVADPAARSDDFMASMGKQYLAYQVGTATGFAERYYQSFVAAGGISALGYVGLIVNNLSSLLTLREIYVVPLTTEAGRQQRLERMLRGLVLVCVPCALFLCVYAEPLVSVFFQRGKFSPEAAALTASVLRILALSLVISTLLGPLERIFQIVDRLLFTHIRYAVAFSGTVVFQTFFVFYLRWDVQGVAWAWLCNGALTMVVVVGLVRRCGITVPWRGVVVNALISGVVSVVALGLSWLVASKYSGFVELVWGGGIYAAALGVCVFATRDRWQSIIG
jgi:putative peptidoglycan lipid II flippase